MADQWAGSFHKTTVNPTEQSGERHRCPNCQETTVFRVVRGDLLAFDTKVRAYECPHCGKVIHWGQRKGGK